MELQVKTKLWTPAATITEARLWAKKLNNLLNTEPDQVPQWVETLGVTLPEYGYLTNVKSNDLKWSNTTAINKLISKCTLVRHHNNEPVSYFALVSIYNIQHKTLEVEIKDFFISPVYRHTEMSKELVQEIANVIILQSHKCNLDTPVNLRILIGSLKGNHIFTKLQNILNNENIQTDINKSIDPTY